MFYYRITRKLGGTGHPTSSYHHFLRPSEAGEYVGSLLADGHTKITIGPVSQATYIRATRPGE